LFYPYVFNHHSRIIFYFVRMAAEARVGKGPDCSKYVEYAFRHFFTGGWRSGLLDVADNDDLVIQQNYLKRRMLRFFILKGVCRIQGWMR